MKKKLEDLTVGGLVGVVIEVKKIYFYIDSD